MINLQSLLLRLWLCIPALLFSVFLSFSSQAQIDCSTDTVGLCTPTIEDIIDETITETIEYQSDGYTVTTTTETTTTTTTVANEDSGDILDGDNGYVASSKEGDMDSDWGGQGPASMPSGTGCGQLGTDKCASITGSGSSTSTMGVDGMGTTFINTVDISDLDIKYGGKTNYTIKVDKQDAQDRIYMHITGKNGNVSVFNGTDVLSESGVASGYQEYEGGFDFSGTITTLIIEVGGRDINLAIGPLFDDVTVNVLYNTINTIVQQSITSVEMWVAYGGSTETEVIDIVENIFEHNDIIEAPDGDMYFEPEFEEPDMDMSYETVEMEMDFEMDFEMDLPDMDIDMPEMEMASVEMEMEMEMEMDFDMDLPEPDMEMPEVEMDMDTEMPEPDMDMSEPEMEPEMEIEAEPTTEPEPEMEEPVNETETEAEPEPADEPADEPKEDVAEEPEAEESAPEADADEDQPEDMEEPEDKNEAEEKPVKKPESKKEKAAKKIVKKMGDKGRYDSQNQLKTLIVMQVLGNTKTFFDSQQQLNDRVGFFTDESLPDAVINDNNIAGYFLFAGSDGLMNDMVMQQWQK